MSGWGGGGVGGGGGGVVSLFFQTFLDIIMNVACKRYREVCSFIQGQNFEGLRACVEGDYTQCAMWG